ncbi:MAG: alcohol dehydrogenase catalytic domain-containing protein [Cyanobacteria bacterium]|nr:alcohol dehydrogenase catalytic domain-containing protein [Cyanobacteriota bacterium]
MNEEQWLGPLLTALRSQKYPKLDLIVVDSGSIDRTREIAAVHCDQVLDIQSDSFSYGYALNFGIGRARADLVAILSAHTMPLDEHWIARLSAPFGVDPAKSGLALTYGKQRGNHVTKLSEDMDFHRQYPDRSRRQRGQEYFCNNANSLIRKDLWKLHPFDETLPGLEDMAWAKHWMDEGFEIEYVADAGILHIHEESWQQVRRRFRREALAARMSQIDLPRATAVVAKEIRAFGHDLVEVVRRASPAASMQAARYRYCKALGTIDGLRTPVQTNRAAGNGQERGEYRALEVQGKNQARMVWRTIPQLKPNEVLIRVSYVGICQTDLEVLRATLTYYRNGQARHPLVPGHEYSGVIVKTGANVETLAAGDNVVGECILSCGVCADCLANRRTACKQRREVGVVNFNGACAEYLVLPARFVHKLPAGVSLLSACTVEPLAVTVKGLNRLGLRHAREAGRSRVLVVGAGALGNLCAQVAHVFGHRVSVVDRIEDRLKPLKPITESIHAALPDNLDRFEYVIECTGSATLAQQLVEQTATGSSVLFLGFPYARLAWDIEQLVAQDKRFVGSVGSDYDTFESAIKLLPSLDLSLFNQTVLELQEWEHAYRIHETKRHLKIKLRVAPAGDATPSRSTTDHSLETAH